MHHYAHLKGGLPQHVTQDSHIISVESKQRSCHHLITKIVFLTEKLIQGKTIRLLAFKYRRNNGY